MKPFTNKIRQARKMAGLTQVQLAQLVHTQQNRVSEVETATNSENLSVGTIRQYAEFFGCTIEDLVPKPEQDAR